MIAGDAGALETLLHRDLKYTHSSGAVNSKESYIRGVREKLWDYQSVNTSNETVSVHGDTALVHCRLQIDLNQRASATGQLSRPDGLDQGRRPLAGTGGSFDAVSEGLG